MFDLTDWELLFVWGGRFQCYAKGNKRVLIDKHTCEVLIEYDFIKGG